ncbi:membrane protein insertase YidC [Bacillus sp. FJAT-42376]|uniref:membrane protein insertase YidC n=1 Tax=Bacillus sp. FJAT-42376 TaxID=2014076 RepID=UPI000F4FEF4A|nr:membrane protein insertase YidC [Bacillus sp. FJAT-42376]AZB44466.1 membrane protein insertase YidC [Bacillus sp. FJAT-42376]
MPNQSSMFTFLKRSSFLILIFSVFLLSGCSADHTPINSETSGFFNHFVVFPFSALIKYTASLFGGSYGVAIILVTFLVRLLLMPFMMKQYKNQQQMKKKMAIIQPEMKKIQAKYKDKKKDPESQRLMQQETLQLYQKHGYNPLAMGCLPILIQTPILFGFYFAIQRTPEIAAHSFLWFDLGHPDTIMPLIAAAVYFFQAKVSQSSMPPEQQKQMAMVSYIMPVMMGAASFGAAAFLPLYWTIGGVFVILQTLLARQLYKENDLPASPKTLEN